VSAPAAAAAGYRAALAHAAAAPRPDRALLRVVGRDPVGMLQGILTNSVPAAAPPPEGGVSRGRASYAAVLTPKGRMVADLRAFRGPHAEEGLLLDVPAAALAGLTAHLGQYLPPRFAKVVSETPRLGALTVVGPDAAALLTREALGLRVDAHELDALAEDAWIRLEGEGDGVLVARSGELSAPAYDVIAERRTAESLLGRLLEAGAAPLDPGERALLRVEAGRPEWGAELDPETIPPEAGIDARAIDHGKGCYTGQEVIVRIRDRGHVNRRLRGLKLGGAPLPARGTELWVSGHGTQEQRAVGTVTTAVRSPRAEGGLALAYLRRAVVVPGEVRVGGPVGPPVAAVALAADWWR
jgi:folate-binding protein YgfZ